MNKLFRKFASLSVAFTMLLASVTAVWASESPVMELSFDGKTYEAGDIATAEVIVYNTSYNVLGFALEYGDNVTVVDENGAESDIGDVLVRLEDISYRGKGIYSVLGCEVTEENIKTTIYVNPNSTDEAVNNNSVTVGSGGRKIATISFKMTEAGIPDVDFATIADDTDFSTVPFFMMENGTQPAGSTAQVKYDTSDENSEVDPPKTDETDADTEDDPVVQPEADNETDGSDVEISTTIPEDHDTVTGGEGTNVNDVPIDPVEEPTDVQDPGDDDGKELSKTERILGIAVLGISMGVTMGVVMKKIMSGVKKED